MLRTIIENQFICGQTVHAGIDCRRKSRSPFVNTSSLRIEALQASKQSGILAFPPALRYLCKTHGAVERKTNDPGFSKTIMKALRRFISSNKTSSTGRRRFLRRLGLFGGLGLVSPAASMASPDEQPASRLAVEPFIGEISMFAGNFPPRNWAFCDGQLLQISQYQALFSILGTTYGGDGRTTFALPDLRGRVPIHSGSGAGPGLTTRGLGSTGGAEAVALGAANIPGHSHTVKASTSEGGFDSPEGRYPARPASGIPQYGDQADTALAGDAVADFGTASPHENMPPFLALNYIIALVGTFPSRN